MSDDAGGTPAQHEDRPVGQLVSDTAKHQVVHDEMRLVAAELQQKGKRLGVGAGLFGGAGILAFYGGAVLVAALVWDWPRFSRHGWRADRLLFGLWSVIRELKPQARTDPQLHRARYAMGLIAV